MINDSLIVEFLILIILFFFSNHQSLLMSWYLGGLYLIIVGFLALIMNGDIFIGFLWVIDLGVGLIFLLFILHFSSFLHSKNFILFSKRNSFFFTISFTLMFTILPFFSMTSNKILLDAKLDSFLLSWYDYYEILFTFNITDLNLLRELYFVTNSFEFFLINFLLFFGILLTILLTFFIQKQTNILITDQLLHKPFLKQMNSTFFIRNQNLMTQQNASTGSRLWKKNSQFFK